MQLTIRHPFACSPERYWDLLSDRTFDAASDRESAVEKTRLEEGRLPDGRRTERLRFRFLDPLPAVAARVLGTPTLTYEQLHVVDDARRSLTWEVVPPVAKERFSAKGTYRVVAAGAGCERIVEGEIKVSVPLVGGTMEEAIGAQIRKSYDRSAVFVSRFLKTGGAA